MRKGFSLLELLLYISLAGTLLLVISVLLGNILQVKVKSQAISEVEAQGLQTMQLLSRYLDQAVAVNGPVSGQNSVSLSLQMAEPSLDPIVVSLLGDSIVMTQAGGGAINLTTDRLIASNLNFINLARSETNDLIRIEFNLSYYNPEGRNEYRYNKDFYGSYAQK